MVVSDGLKCTESNFWSWRIIGLAGTLVLFFNLYAGCGIPVSRTTIIPKDVAQTTEQLIGKLDLLKTGMEIGEVYELLDIKRTTPGAREIVNAESKPENFQQEESTRIYISDLFGSMFKVGASRGVSQIGN